MRLGRSSRHLEYVAANREVSFLGPADLDHVAAGREPFPVDLQAQTAPVP